MTDALDVRRKRAAYRAAHRGTKEMDALVGRYAVARLSSISQDGMNLFEKFLQIADPTLESWILARQPVDQIEFESLVCDIRSFHGLDNLVREYRE